MARDPEIQNSFVPPVYSTPAVNTIFLLLGKTQTACFPCWPWRRCLALLRCCILKHLPLSEDILIRSVVNIRVVVLCLALEQVEDVFHGELADGLATLDSCLCELALCFL
jgi:hypothetical protein